MIPEFDAEPLCAEVDPELFFPDRGNRNKPAIDLCHRCELEDACRDWAVSDPAMEGIWGGTTAEDRAAIRQAMGVA